MLSLSPSLTLPTLDWNASFHRFETEINGIASFPKKNVVIIYMHCGLFQKKSKEWRHGISRGIKEDMEIPEIKLKRVQFSPNQKTIMWNFPWVLVFGLGIPKCCSTYNFVEFPEVKLCFLQNFQGQSDKPKNSRDFLKYSSTTHVWFFFSEIAQ